MRPSLALAAAALVGVGTACTPASPTPPPPPEAPSAPAVSASASATPPAPSATQTSADDAGSDAASTADTANPDAGRRLPNAPLVRATKWVCDEQECEAKPTIAYDYLPAVTTDRATVAVVEERDGWGHVPHPGVRLLHENGRTELLRTVTGASTSTFAEFQAKRAAHEAAVADTNRALAARTFVPLLPMTAKDTQTFSGGRWGTTGTPKDKTRKAWAAGGVVLYVVYKNGEGASNDGTSFEEIVVEQDGKEVKRARGQTFGDKPGCSARKLVVTGVRPDLKVLAFGFTNGMTGHNCDGTAEPQVHHVVRW